MKKDAIFDILVILNDSVISLKNSNPAQNAFFFGNWQSQILSNELWEKKIKNPSRSSNIYIRRMADNCRFHGHAELSSLKHGRDL